MVDVDRAVIARLIKQGKHFEILVDCDAALAYKQGEKIPLQEVLATQGVFKDVKRGEKASEHDFKTIFNTEDITSVIDTILKRGEIQLTTAHREKEREEKRKKIITIIHRNAIDSKTGLPHPPQRIENAMKEARIVIDDHKSAEDQVKDILTKLRAIIPIRFETREIELIIPATYAAKSFTTLKKQTLLKDEWMNDGSLRAVVEIPAGIQDEFFDELNAITRGSVHTKILKTKE